MTLRSLRTAALLALAASGAGAQPPPPADAAPPPWYGRLSLSVRTGYALPVGDFKARGSEGWLPGLSRVHSNLVPLWVDAQVWATRRLSVGPYLQVGPTFAGAGCPDGASCAGSVLRYGLGGAWHFPPRSAGRPTPWVGLSAGRERASFRVDDLKLVYTGTEYLALQAGGDWPLGRWLEAGPFATLTWGRYGHERVEAGGLEGEADIQRPARHHWFFVGVRLRARPAGAR